MHALYHVKTISTHKIFVITLTWDMLVSLQALPSIATIQLFHDVNRNCIKTNWHVFTCKTNENTLLENFYRLVWWKQANQSQNCGYIARSTKYGSIIIMTMMSIILI